MNPITGHILNLEHRLDRWLEIVDRFKDIKTINLERVIGQKHPVSSTIGATQSHLDMIRMAKEQNLPYILVLEDDCLLQDPQNFDQRFTEILKWIDQHPKDWDIFNGGPTYVEPKHVQRLIKPDLPIVEITFGYTVHFVIYNHTAYDRVLSCPYDRVIDYHTAITGSQITTVPYLAIQAPSYSDIQNIQTDYKHIFLSAQTIIENSLGRFQINNKDVSD